MACSYGRFAAPADLGGGKLRKPVESSIVDGFSDIDSEIEAAVVASPKDKHELPGLVLHFGDVELWVLLLEEIGIDEGGFVPQVLSAFAEMLGEQVFCLLFQDVGLVRRDTVPKLGFSLVEVVDSR